MTRSILISGCSSGIGLACARVMRDRGWRVFASCRAEADCETLRAEGFEAPRLDQADPASIDAAFAEVLAATGGTLDAVYPNGAWALPGAMADTPRAALREIFEANFFGVHDMVRAALPVMLKQGHGRIVLCSSILGIAAMRYRGPYTTTKFASEGFGDTLRLELRDLPGARDIHLSMLVPGPIQTEIRYKSAPHFERWIDWAASPWREVYEGQVRPSLYKPRKEELGRIELKPEAVARRLVHACEAKRPKPRYFITVGTWGVEGARRLLPTRLRDALMRHG